MSNDIKSKTLRLLEMAEKLGCEPLAVDQQIALLQALATIHLALYTRGMI